MKFLVVVTPPYIYHYVRYSQITPGYLTRDQYKIQVTYNVKYSTEVLLDQMETGQEFTIAGNTPFSD